MSYTYQTYRYDNVLDKIHVPLSSITHEHSVHNRVISEYFPLQRVYTLESYLRNGIYRFQKIYHRLREVVIDKEGLISEEAEYCCEKLAHVFENQNILDFNVDYGKKYKAISLDIVVNDGLEFLVRLETEDPSRCVVFSIIRDDVLLYTNNDLLEEFQQSVEQFFSHRKAVETNAERLKMYPDDTSLYIISEDDVYSVPKRITSEIKFCSTY